MSNSKSPPIFELYLISDMDDLSDALSARHGGQTLREDGVGALGFHPSMTSIKMSDFCTPLYEPWFGVHTPSEDVIRVSFLDGVDVRGVDGGQLPAHQDRVRAAR